jgi:DNA-directed RNA polymerase sigma subunit (sigma70/sigma32)
MWSQTEETKAAEQIAECLLAIRRLICSYEMAADFHIYKGQKTLEGDFSFLSDEVCDGENLSKSYLELMPELIDRTVDCNEQCAELWFEELTAEYQTELARLMKLLAEYQFKDSYYEKLARITEKPMLAEAYQLIESGKDDEDEVYRIETRVRMTLEEFIKNEELIKQNLQLIDANREKISAAHEWMAVETAQEFKENYQEALEAAKFAIFKATHMFNHQRGYSFADYAKWWIKKAVEDLAHQ